MIHEILERYLNMPVDAINEVNVSFSECDTYLARLPLLI